MPIATQYIHGEYLTFIQGHGDGSGSATVTIVQTGNGATTVYDPGTARRLRLVGHEPRCD